MNYEQKTAFLQSLGTRELLEKITAQADLLEQQLKDDAKYRYENVRYLGNYGDDCQEVKALIADMTLNPPIDPETKKKPTVAMMEAWIKQQRDQYQPLKEAINQQNKVNFQVETNRIEIDMARKRLESLRGILALRTAQIQFLSNGVS